MRVRSNIRCCAIAVVLFVSGSLSFAQMPPEVTGPGHNFLFNHCDTAQIMLTAMSVEGDPFIAWEIMPDDGSVGTVDNNGFWTWSDMPLSGIASFQVRAMTDFPEYSPWWYVNVVITNDPPSYDPPGAPMNAIVGQQGRHQLSIVDDDCLGAPVLTISDYGGIDPGRLGTWEHSLIYLPIADEVGLRTVTVMADDTENQVQFDVTFNVVQPWDCCIAPTLGDLDQSGQLPPEKNVDGIDLSIMLDMLFISLSPVPCLVEADLDLSGAPNPQPEDVDGTDLSYMLDHLFINLDPLPTCP